MKLLIKMKHGLGDCVQLLCVLRHLKHFHPDWHIGVEARAGTHSLYEELADDVYLLGQGTSHRRSYDQVLTLPFRHVQTGTTVGNVPHTKVFQCLYDQWPDLYPVEEFFHYQIPINDQTKKKVDKYLEDIPQPYVIFHSRGTASREEKDLLDYEEACLAEMYLNDGYSIVVLEWRNQCKILDREGIYCPGANHDLWKGLWKQCGCAQIITELGNRADVCVGIDSGPGHCWGATDTETYICWVYKHPVHCYDLANNVIHVVPTNVEDYAYSSEAHQYFKDTYKYVEYGNLTHALEYACLDSFEEEPPPLQAEEAPLRKIQ